MQTTLRCRTFVLAVMPACILIGTALFCYAQVPALKPDGDPDSKPSKIIVADDRSYAPFAFLDLEGVPRGVTIDIWNLWSRKTGIPVEFRLMEWEAALAAVQDGEADVVGGLFRTPSREEIFDFTQAFYKISTGVFFSRNIMGIRGLGELNGFLVGVVKGDSAEDTIRVNNPAIRLELFPDTESMVKAALAGKIKVFVADTFVVRFYLAKHDSGEEFLEAFNLVTDNEQYAAVRKGNRPLLEILQQGFNQISPSEIQKIIDTWTGMSLFSRIPWASIWTVILLVVAALAVMILWNLQLKRKVARATRELWQRNEDLLCSERNYRELVENTNSIIMRMDKECRITFFNNFAQKFFGFREEEIIGRSVIGTIVPETDSAGLDLRTILFEIARYPEAYANRINENMRRNGERVWIAWTNKPVLDETGGIREILCVGNDISERKRTEEMLLQRDRLLKAQNDILLELMANGKLFRGNFQDAIQEITESCSLLLGVERVSVWLYSDDYETIHCVDQFELSKKCHSRGEELRSADFPAYTMSHRQGRVIVATDVFTDPRTREIPESYFREHDIRSLMDAPIWMGQRIHGLLSFEATGCAREWSPEEERLANIMAAMVSLGFEIAERKRAEEALREREGILQSLLAAATVGVVLLKDRVFFKVNAALCKITGYSEEELLGHTTRILYPSEEEYIRAGQALYGQLEREGLGVMESQFQRKDGASIDVLLCLSPFDPEDLSAGVCATVLDITERKRVELYHLLSSEILEILNEPADLYDSLYRILDAIKQKMRCDAVGIRLCRNDDFPYFVQNGFSSDFLIQENTLLVRDPNGGICKNEDGSVCLECTCGLVISGKTDPSNPLFTPGGSCWTNDSLPILDLPESDDPRLHPRNRCIHEGYSSVALIPIRTQKQIAGLLQLNAYQKDCFTLNAIHSLEGIAAHIGEALMRKQAEEALRESENYFRSMMEQSPFSMMVFSPEGYLLQSNDAYVRLWGVSRERSKNYNILKDSNIRDFGFLPLFERAFAGERITIPPHEYDLESTLGQGTRKVVQGDLYPLRDESGAIRYVILVHLDITEQKRAEEEREKLQAQLVQAQKIESVGRLAGGVAHDFNNMLGVILGHTELALMKVNPGEVLHTDLKEIEKAASRSADLTRQLLAFARKQTVTPKVLDLNEAIEGMLKMLRRLIGEDIHLAWIPGTSLGAVKIDPSQIDQIMANLCVNARDAIQGNGQITIETKNVEFDDLYCTRNAGFMPGEFVMLAVDDNGCGMDKETQGKIFEPFFTTKEVGRGTGLGLATVFGIVKQNDGFINVYSEPGKGSSFKIYLPRIEKSRKEIQDSSVMKPLQGGGETILLVEDEPMILGMGQMMLEMLGYRVLAAGTPGEAIRLAEKHAGEIHLLMTDVIMPEMNGRDLAQRLLSLYPNLKLLFMSGYTADVIAHQGVLDEGVAFLQKPFTLKDLSIKVRETLQCP